MEFLTVNGFGTLGGAYQNNEEILYRDLYYADQGTQGEFSLANYSLLGLQLDFKQSDRLNFTLQGIVSANTESSKPFDLQWANINYQASDDFILRAGLMRLPAYMFSDVYYIAYLYDRISLPDMYSIVPFNKYKGIEVSYNRSWNDWFIGSTFLYGKANSRAKFVREGELHSSAMSADNVYGIDVKFVYDSLSFRIGYLRDRIRVHDGEVERIFSEFNAMGIPQISQAIETYTFQDASLNYLNFGVRYDFENSYVLGEYLKANSDSFIPDMTSWYISAGYNFEEWTPYVLYSKSHQYSNYQPLTTEGVPEAMIEPIMIANYVFSHMGELPEVDRETSSVGFRYNLNENTLLKFQYENQKRLGARLNVFSGAASFVF
ncbi:MAG TPA: hypothetical protein ENK86_01285 [Campylobacterales bacterium]|nr:hypothetical protein [Campylobacterales bacterium]